MKPLDIKLNRYKSVSIVGLEKNVGKTTTLNWLIRLTPKTITLGITSIGIDGESIDQVTGSKKPRIYIPKGSIVATATQSYYKSDCTKELLLMTGVNTPIGEVIIYRSLSDGYVELAGVSVASQVKELIVKMQSFGSDIVYVDGALSRISIAAPTITDATILVTGAVLSPSNMEVVEQTKRKLKYLSLPLGELEWNEVQEVIKQSKLLYIQEGKEIITTKQQTILGAENMVLELINKGAKAIILGGAFTDNLAEKINKKILKGRRVSIYIENGTKCLLSDKNYNALTCNGVSLKVLQQIKVIAITYNPISLQGIGQSIEEFKLEMGDIGEIPIYDVYKENV